MLRNCVIVAVMGLLGSALVPGQVGAGTEKGAQKQAPYVHTVIFYLKQDAPKEAAALLIEDSHKLLAKIPTVRQLWAGRPAKDATPKVAVTDFQVGLSITFDDYAGLKTYIDHELHTQFLNRNGKHIEKVLVYDFANQMK
jgi:hypothetical protein